MITFTLRPIGNNWGPCFVCGAGDNNTVQADRSIFVKSKEDGEAIVAMFKQGVRLDFREHEPTYIQVKFTACDLHKQRLEELEIRTRCHVMDSDLATRLTKI